jgi:DNA-binding transcriptional LysR family regulator
MKRIDWDDLKVFTALARAGSVRAAAAALGVHHSTVTRRLDQFEKMLGARLFDRTPEGLKLSHHGAAVLARAEGVEGQIEAIERTLFGRDERLAGTVKLTFPDAMGVGFLMRELARFAAQYPEIGLEFIASDVALNLGRREADVAIRVTRRPPEHLIGRPLGRVRLAVYASQEYLAAQDPVLAPETCNWIAWSAVGSMGEGVRQQLFPAVPSRMVCPNALMLLAAAEAGVGIALLPCALGDQSPSLVRIGADDVIEGLPIWLLVHTDLRNAARVQAVTRWIAAAFARNEDLLMGQRTWDKAHRPQARKRR